MKAGWIVALVVLAVVAANAPMLFAFYIVARAERPNWRLLLARHRHKDAP